MNAIDEITKLDLAWEKINALGGASISADDLAFNYGIEKALNVIEELGGRDPAARRAMSAPLSSADRVGK